MFVRTLGAVIAAGVFPLLLATVTVANLVREDKEAALVDGAIAETLSRRALIQQRRALARSELGAVALAGASGRLLDVPSIVSDPMVAVRCERRGETLVDVASSPRVSERLGRAVRTHGGPTLLDELTTLEHVRVGDVDAYGLLDLSRDLALPQGWSATVLGDGGDTSAGVVAQRTRRGDRELVSVTAPLDARTRLAVLAPIDPARSAAVDLAREVIEWSLLVIVPLALLAFVFARAVTSPVRALARAVRDAGGEPVRMPPLPADEIGDLGEAIAAMSAQLHEDTRVLHVAARFARALGRVASASEVYRELQAALEESFPGHAWYVCSSEDVDDGHVPADAPADAAWLRAQLDAAAREEAPRRGDSTGAIKIAVVPGTAGECTAIVLASDESTFGIVVTHAELDEAVLRMAELLCRSAAGALAQLRFRESAAVNEKLTLLGRMSASVAHEMNNPLAFVTANLRTLEETLSGEHADVAREAREGAERLGRIVHDLSSMAKGGTRQTRLSEDLESIAQVCAKYALARRAGAAVRVVSDGPVHVLANRGRIEQALLNLIINGIDAAAAAHGRADVVVRVAREGSRAVIDVSDNGPGVPPSVQRRIFEAFYTTKGQEGTGLGLFLSQSFVEADGGELTLSRTGPSGTTFRIVLPRHEERARSSAPPAERGARSGDAGPPERRGRARVLLLDDEPAIVRAMTRWLRNRVEILGTTDPEEALRIASTEHLSLVICDLNMPRMSGQSFIAALAERRPDLRDRVIVMTGSDDVRLSIPVLRKPVAPERMYEILDAL